MLNIYLLYVPEIWPLGIYPPKMKIDIHSKSWVNIHRSIVYNNLEVEISKCSSAGECIHKTVEYLYNLIHVHNKQKQSVTFVHCLTANHWDIILIISPFKVSMVFNIFIDLCKHHHDHIYIKILPDLLKSGIAEFSYFMSMKSISTSTIKCKNMAESQKHLVK